METGGKTLTLFHGSPAVVREPSPDKERERNDYGRGFYCTESEDLAKEWACTEGADGWANRYELRTDGLRMLSLSSPAYSILHWMALLVRYRDIRLHAPVMRRGAAWLLANYGIDLAPWDVVVGWCGSSRRNPRRGRRGMRGGGGATSTRGRRSRRTKRAATRAGSRSAT